MLKPEMNETQKRPSQRLLGSRATQSELSWTSYLRLEDEPWLSDQILLGNKTFPTSGYIAIAGECMRQLSESKLQSFSVKDLSIKSALFLDSNNKIELSTRLQPKEQDEDKRQWYAIEIACRNGTDSIGLCAGLVAREVAIETEIPQDIVANGTACRSVSSDYWYGMIADRGIEYGVSQRRLSDISVACAESKASVTIVPVHDAADPAAHPVFIDHCLQVSMIAACRGQGRLLTDLYVIKSIQHLTIFEHTWERLRVNGAVNPGLLQDSVYKFSALNERGTPILSGQCEIAPVSDLERHSDSKLFSFTKWETDSTYHNLNQLLAPFQPDLDSTIVLERLALLYALRSEDIGAQNQRYSKRILKMIGNKRKGRFGLVPDISPFLECEPSNRVQLVKSLKAQISGSKLSSLDKALESSLANGSPFSGSASERQLLLDQLHPLVRNNGTLAESLRLLAHKNPKLNILEFGSDATDNTNLLLKAVTTEFDEPLYSSYLFASTSAIATTSSTESLKESRNFHSLLFDAGKSIEQQGLKAGTFDLIIITDFATLASDAKTGAETLKRLLHPRGHVILLDGVAEPEWSSTLKDYLTKESSNVSAGSKPRPSFEDVYAALLKNGFVFDGQDNEAVKAPKVFASLKPSESTTSSEVTIVAPAYQLPLVREVEKTFEQHNIKCAKSTIDGKIPLDRDLLVFVDFDEPYLYNITEAELSQLLKLVSSMKAKIIWVTPGAQISCKNPNSSLILGLMRTLRSEFKKDITVVELESKRAINASLSKSLLKIYKGLSHRVKSKDLDYDYEHAIVDGEIKTPRLQWTTAKAEYAHMAARSAANEVGIRNFSPATDKVSATAKFRPDCCYVLVGGLGGLGRMISTWMVENGARNIVFFSRSAKEGPGTTPFFDELRAQGCTVIPFAGSVTNLQDVQKLVKQAEPPIAGVIQMSAVMRDNLMSQMTFSDWQASVEPKVQGTWNLHHATSSLDLDFFLLFSSICGITGQWGQGNYNAANSFLDAFVNYRHGQNLPASVVDIGFMGSIGMAVESDALVKHLKGSGYHYLNERHLIDALTISLANSHPEANQYMRRSQMGLGIRSTKPMTTPACRVVWKKDPRMAISHHLESIGGTGSDEVKNLLNRAYSTGTN